VASPKEAQAKIVPVPAPPGPVRNILITGSNSGIGKVAAARLAAGGYNVFLACRTLEKAEAAKESILQEYALSDIPVSSKKRNLVPVECDLADLNSVRNFAKKFTALGIVLDVLVMNAGLSLSTEAKPPPPRTSEGFELTVGTNHLGHFLLCNLLLKNLMSNPNGARIVVTASQVHDPDSPGGNVGKKATLGDLKGLETGNKWDMVDGGPYDGDKAYKDSKLCNVLFTRELAKRLSKVPGNKVTCNCFSPGLITGSGLFRNQGSIFVPVFSFAVNNIFRVGETVDFGGSCLIKMAVGSDLEDQSGVFWANSKPGKHTFEQVEVSKEARDDYKAKKLWSLSRQAVKLKAAESAVGV